LVESFAYKRIKTEMRLILTLIHVAVCIALILIVLLQRGKGSDMGAAFGGSSQAVFGSQGATSFMHRITAGSAIIFMITSLLLALIFSRGSTSSIMKGVSPTEAPATQQAPSPAPAGDQGE
jgi:preprotein translocase subunit SecG